MSQWVRFQFMFYFVVVTRIRIPCLEDKIVGENSMDVSFVNSRRYKNLRSCLIFYRHKNVLVCELICMITGVLFIQASNCTLLFLISHYTSSQINRDVSHFHIVMFTVQFSVVWFVT